MAKLLLNANGKVLMKDDKVYKAPEGVNPLQTLITGKGAKAGKSLFQDYQGDNVDFIKDLDFSANENCSYMFQKSSITKTPLINTNNVNDMSYMYNGCLKLQTIDITSMDGITSTSQLSNFATNCYELTKFVIRTMTVIPPLHNGAFRSSTHFEDKTARIYVPDDFVEQLKSATNWSEYADIIVPLSTLEE